MTYDFNMERAFFEGIFWNFKSTDAANTEIQSTWVPYPGYVLRPPGLGFTRLYYLYYL